MRVLLRTLLTVGLTVLAISAAPATVTGADCAPNDTVCRQLQDAKQSQADTSRRLQDIQQSLASTQTKASQTLAVIDGLKAQIAVQQGKIAQTQSRLAATVRQIQLTEA